MYRYLTTEIRIGMVRYLSEDGKNIKITKIFLKDLVVLIQILPNQTQHRTRFVTLIKQRTRWGSVPVPTGICPIDLM